MRVFLLLALVVAGACRSAPEGACPRGGLDTARRCKRLCVLTPQTMGQRPLECYCMDECLCWEMAGHSRRPERQPK